MPAWQPHDLLYVYMVVSFLENMFLLTCFDCQTLFLLKFTLIFSPHVSKAQYIFQWARKIRQKSWHIQRCRRYSSVGFKRECIFVYVPCCLKMSINNCTFVEETKRKKDNIVDWGFLWVPFQINDYIWVTETCLMWAI